MEIIDLPASLVSTLSTVGSYLFFAVVAAFGLWVISTFITKIPALREG
jgi:hypothetical protein